MRLLIIIYFLIIHKNSQAEELIETPPIAIQAKLSELNKNYGLAFPQDLSKRTPQMNAIHNWITKYSTFATRLDRNVGVKYFLYVNDKQHKSIMLDEIYAQDKAITVKISLNSKASTKSLYMDTARLFYILNSLKNHILLDKPIDLKQFDQDFYKACRSYEAEIVDFDEKNHVSDVIDLDENVSVKKHYGNRLQLDDENWMKNHKLEYECLRENLLMSP